MSAFKKHNALSSAYDLPGTREEGGWITRFPSNHRQKSDSLFWVINWLALAFHLSVFLESPQGYMWVYQAVLLGTYALMFSVPAWLLSRPAAWLPRNLELAVQVLLTAAVHLLIHADNVLWGLYHYVLNGFVWNSVPSGGLLGLLTAESTRLAVALTAGAYLLVQIVLRLLASGIIRFAPRMRLPRLSQVVMIFLIATLAERASYAISHKEGYRDLMDTAERIPLYQPLILGK